MGENVSVLISTCDKFSDLWDTHIALYKKNWNGPLWKTYLVTDKPTEKHYDGVEIIVADGDLDFPMRIRYALDRIDTDYVLVTLDDYFLIEKAKVEGLAYLAEQAEKEAIDYLMLYDRRKTNPKRYTPIDKLEPIDLARKYAVTLYPAIWNKRFLFNSVKSDMNPWYYEPSLTYYARENGANCQFSHSGTFVILDVVRKGKVLHKANRYLKKNGIDIGDRPLAKRSTEMKLAIMDFIDWHMPRWFFRMTKSIAKKFGMKFYSED